MNFFKYHGLGNDYLVFDTHKHGKTLSGEAVRKICHRHFGLGADGILEGPYMTEEGISVKIFNPDGSVAEKSGNGVRIFSKYLKDADYPTEQSFELITLGGKVHVRYNNKSGSNMTVSMGKLSFSRKDIGAVNVPDEMVDIPLIFNETEYRCTCVSIGNPHCVIPLGRISKDIVCNIGKYSETAKYFPNRINTQIVKVIDRSHIEIEIYERGAGYTLASGSSSCAAAGAMFRLGLVDNEIDVHMPGGVLHISIDEHNLVQMTGDVCYVGEMILPDDFLSVPQF